MDWLAQGAVLIVWAMAAIVVVGIIAYMLLKDTDFSK